MTDRQTCVAVGLRPQADLDALGHGLRTTISVGEVAGFEALPAAIDIAEQRTLAAHGR